MPSTPPAERDHIVHNERYWDAFTDAYQESHATQLPTKGAMWSVFRTLEADIRALGDIADRDIVELGCGGAQFSIALARTGTGARCTGVDISKSALEHAETLLAATTNEDGVRPDVSLVHAAAEKTGLADASFDIAFSDYGASMFADPYLWIPEAARILRPGGRLAFSAITPVLEMCWPEGQSTTTPTLVRDYFGMHRIEDHGVNFNLPYGEWIRLFRRSGFDVLDLIETRPADEITETAYRSENQVAWAKRWPAEMIWVLERRA